MRRADRLFRIVQALRRRRLLTAAQLAEQLEVSERTVYRDVRDLELSGVPIRGEAGVGYTLARNVDLPPLMFDLEEIEALVLGVRMVERWGDEDLRRAARAALDKIDGVVPRKEQIRLDATALFAVSFRPNERALEQLGHLRKAVSERRRVSFEYEDQQKRASRRAVRPLGLFFWGHAWTVGAWCELREDYRNFRLDRIASLRVLKTTFVAEPPCTLEAYRAAMRER